MQTVTLRRPWQIVVTLGLLICAAPGCEINDRPGNITPARPKVANSEIYKKITALREARSQQPSLSGVELEKAQEAFYQFKKSRITEPKAVRAALSNVLKLNPYHPAALAEMGQSFLKVGEYAPARDYATQCVAVDDSNAACHRLLFESYNLQKNPDANYVYLQDCLGSDPDNPHCLTGMMSLLTATKRFKEAKPYLDRLIRLDPTSGWSHLAQAGFYEASGEKDLARSHYSSACKLGQTFACGKIRQPELPATR